MSIPRIKAPSKERDALLRLEEDHFVDLKSRRTPPRDLQKHLVAFANTDGGDIYVGIEDPIIRFADHVSVASGSRRLPTT